MAKDENYNIRKVTPRGLKILKNAGLLDGNLFTLGQACEIYLDETKLREVCDAVFAEDMSKMEYDDINLEVIGKGIRDFLQKLVGN